MSEITKPILLNETGQETNQKLDTLAAKEQLIADAINNVARNYTDIHAAAVSAQQQATAAAASAAAADNSADDAADSAAAAAQKLDDLETFLGGLDPESAASVAAELGLFEQEVASDYAKKDGYYEQMGVGTADNLAGHGSVNAEYTFRTSGGDSDIGTGAAAIDTVKGNTLVWNQLVQNGDFASGTNHWSQRNDTSLVVQNGIATLTTTKDGVNINQALYNTGVSFINGHKYLICITAITNGIDIRVTAGKGTLPIGGILSDGVFSTIFTCSQNITNLYIAFENDVSVTTGSSFSISNVMTFDLTLMFGSGYEPSTVDEFESLYPLDYYAYNAGTLINNSASGIKTIGFNQWDEQWEVGDIDNSTGQNTSADNRIRCKNYINVFPSTIYYFKSSTNAFLYFYDVNKQFISYSDFGRNDVFTTPSNAYYVRFKENSAYGTIYKNDICINLSWSGYRNGEYEPYEEHTVYFDSDLGASGSLATIKGKLLVDGQPTGESVEVFPDGLKSAGSVYDEIKGNVAIKRIGSVDLGTLDYAYISVQGGFTYVFSGAKPSALAVCTKYTYNSTTWGADKTFGFNETIPNPDLWIKDSSYTDAETFKAAMSGVILYYELATPETYLLDNPLPVNYVVNDFGTEQRLPADTSSSVMAPILYSVQYAMNATDTIRRLPINYISKDSFENFCASLASAIGPYLNPPATIAVTPTYNDYAQEYDYQVTVTPIENNG